MFSKKFGKKRYLFITTIIVVSIILFLSFTRFKSPMPTQANYSKEYIEKNRGKVVVEIPEVYELANIAIAISDYGLKDPYHVNKQSLYYKQVLKHFLPFKKHPLIRKIDELLNVDGKSAYMKSVLNYYRFRDNSACYVFKGNSIVPGGIYPEIWSPDLFKKYIKLVEDFAKVTQFRKFYQDNLPYYQEQIQKYKEEVPVRKMWVWLERNFPERYDCYKIIFSPLIGCSHCTKRFESKGFKEIVMFISGPGVYKKSSGKVREGLLSRIVFTEIDHNYVNPITERYSNRVSKAFSDVEKWNKQSGYCSPFGTFNEYMTWAVFTLYAYDNYNERDFKAINQIVVYEMVKSRKFVLFKQFDEKLLELYLNRKKGETIPDLYPKILEWAEKM